MSADTRPISQRTDAELALQVLGSKGRPDPLTYELAQRLAGRLRDDELLADVPGFLRRQAG